MTLGAKKLYEIVRSLPESDVSLKVEGDAWARIRCERVDFKMAGLPREDFPTLPEARAGRAGRDSRRAPPGPHPAHGVRDHRGGRPLLPGRGPARPREGGGRRWSRRTATAWPGRSGRRPLKVGEAVRVLVPRKAIAELPRLDRGSRRRGERLLPAGRRPHHLRRRRTDARLEDGRGPVPGLREGRGRDRGQEGERGPRGAAERDPAGEPPLLRAGPGGAAQPRGRPARGERLLARARRGPRVAARRVRGRARSRSASTPSTCWTSSGSWAPTRWRSR